MTQKVSSVEDIKAALPAVQAAVRKEIAKRIANGEKVGGIDTELEARLKQQKLELLTRLSGKTGSADSPSRRRKARRSAA